MPAAHAMRHDTVERSQRAQPAIQKVLLVPWHGSAPHNLTRWLVARRAKVCACVACSRHTPLFCDVELDAGYLAAVSGSVGRDRPWIRVG